MTGTFAYKQAAWEILIHTSVKLVTCPLGGSIPWSLYFNPHEREARDITASVLSAVTPYFNPHEREARDKKEDRKEMILFQF